MYEPQPRPPRSDSQDPSEEIRRLVIMWAACCVSPIVYLGATWVIQQYFMNETGFWPLSPARWTGALIGLTVFIILLQGAQLLLKHRYKSRLAAAVDDSDTYIQLLTRRTILLIVLSEFSVFSGFCLFLLQGNPVPVFAAGVAAMFLYAQSHPRSGLPSPHI